MKLRMCILAFCLCWAWVLQGRSLTVIHASPKCKDVATGKPFAAGQLIDASIKVDLGGASGKLVVWDSEKGLLVLGAQKTGEKQWKTSGTVADLNQALPAIVPYAGHFHSLADLQQHFSGRKYLLLGSSWLVADPPFRLGGDTVLFYKYERVTADAEVSRKVEHRADSLLLEPKFILDMNGQALAPADARNFQLYWMDKKKRGFSELARFEFVFADEEVLKREVGVLLGVAGAVPAKTERGSEERSFQSSGPAPSSQGRAGQVDLVRQFLTAVYGSPDPHNLQAWLDLHFPVVD